jgi:signal transduction histidine kinase
MSRSVVADPRTHIDPGTHSVPDDGPPGDGCLAHPNQPRGGPSRSYAAAMATRTGWGWLRWGVVAFVAGWLAHTVWPEPLLLAAVLGEGVALVLAHRLPLIAMAAAFVGLISLGERTHEESPFLLALIVAAFHVGRFASVSRQPWAAAAVLALTSGAVFDGGDDPVVADIAFPIFLIGGPWILGLIAQLTDNRADRALDYARSLEDLRAAELRGALAEERLRIAQDLHDVVAHNITALSLQAQLARRGVRAGVPVTEGTLREMERTAQAAMVEVRRALSVLRTSDDAPERQPGLADLPALVGAGRAVGHRISVTVQGEERLLPPALDSAAHRILQEALTNARRHGDDGGITSVRLAWTTESLHIDVCNPAADGEVSVGHGIAGITERARMLGGSAEAVRDAGEWRLSVTLPLPAKAVATAVPG